MLVRKNEIPISKIWAARFHLSTQTNDWVFYVSRPTLEMLRKPGSEGNATYKAVKETIEKFLSEHPSSTNFQADVKPFKIKTSRCDVKEDRLYCTLSYPFDIRDEIDNKLGVVLHVSDSTGDDAEPLKIETGDNYPSMFDKEFMRLLRGKLENLPNNNHGKINPPGVVEADPMWREFASSKILPTDQLLNKNTRFGKFRNIISHQYIEIRLHRSRSKEKNSSREQLDALQKFESFSSGFTNFAGPPGTGKSTLLHMVCAHRLFTNFRERRKDEHDNVEKGDREEKTKILYYLHSKTLRDEAIREIKSILEEVYAPILYMGKYKENYTTKDIDKDIAREIENSIVYINQESLISSQVAPKQNRNVLREASNKPLGNSIGKHSNKAEIAIVKRGLRNVVFGMFGSHAEYRRWASSNKNWSQHIVNFHRPSGGRSAQNHELVMSDFLPNELNSNIKNHLDKFRRKTARLIEKNLLWDGTDSDQFWDPSCLFYLTYLASQNDDFRNPDSWWEKLKNKVDWIVIDEIQDTSLVELRILLDHFANRVNGAAYRNFRLIVAGDENQNVNHLLYLPQNRHFKFAFENWAQHLKEAGGKTQELFRLSHHLSNDQPVLLKSGYRVFNQMFPYANDIMNSLREHHKSASTGRGKKPELVETNYGRNGVFVRLNGNIRPNHVRYLDAWQNSILAQLRKQMLTTILESEEFEPTSAEPIRVAFTYDKDDFDEEFKSSGRLSPFTNRLTDDNKNYINDTAENLDMIMADFSNAFAAWCAKNAPDLKEDSILDEMKRALQLRGVMDVSSIKGLTMPVSFILPSKRLTEGKAQETMEDLSKFLVQITRAQYFNVIIDDTRSFSKELDDNSIIKNNDQPIEDIGEWLDSVLNHSAGFDHAFNRIFQMTMEEYGSKMLWTRLKEESKKIHEDIDFLIHWLHDLLWNLKHHEDWDPEFWGGRAFTLNKQGVSTHINSTQDKRSLTLTKCAELETEYMLGEPRFDEEHLTSLRLFLVINKFLRNQSSDNHSNRVVSSQMMAQAIERWVSHLPEDNVTERKTIDWFKLFANPTHDEKNLICQSIARTFDPTSPQWPREPLARLYMGGWRIKNTARNADTSTSEDDLSQFAWMDNDSAFFFIRPEVLDYAITDKRHVDENYNSKLRLFLGLTSLNAPIFSAALADLIKDYTPNIEIGTQLENAEKNRSGELLDWFVRIFADEAPGAEEKEFDRFKVKVRKELEKIIKGDDRQLHREALTNYLESLKGISAFSKTLEAFGFEDWRSCIKGKNMFEKIINLAYKNAMAVLRLKKCDEEINKNALEVADAIQDEMKAERKRNEAVSSRSRYINANREAIQEDLGLVQKIQEYGFEKGRTRSTSDAVVVDEQQIVELLDGDELTPDSPLLRPKGTSMPVDRDRVNEWRRKLKPFNENVDETTEKWEKKVVEKTRQRRVGDTLKNLRFDFIEELKENREVFTLEQYQKVKRKDMSYEKSLQVYNEALRNPFARSDENQMYQFFKSQLEGKSDHPEHMNWFNLLWGMDAVLSGMFSDKDFKTYPLRFPSTKGEVVGKIHALVDAYCNIEEASIDRMSRLIKSGISPKPMSESENLITGFTSMMKSLSEAYTTSSRKELEYLKTLKIHDKSSKQDTLRDKIYGKFMKKHATGIQEMFLSYLLNQIEVGKQCIMNNQELRTYLSSPQAKLVFATITGDYLTEADEDEMLSTWVNLKWKNTENTRFEHNNDDFMDRIHINESSTLPDGQKGPPPLLHQIWFRPPFSKKFESRFNNAAVYRGFACLALKQPSKAANEFKEGGLHNHAAALDLIEAFEQDDTDARYHLLTTVQKLCKETSKLYGKSMFADHTMVSSDRVDHNNAYRYGLGPFSEYRYKVKPENGKETYSRLVSVSTKLFRPKSINGNEIVIEDVKGKPYYPWGLELMEHATWVEHADILGEGLACIEATSTSRDEYLEKFKDFIAAYKHRFTMFRDDLTKVKDKRGREENKDNRHKFIWKWEEAPKVETIEDSRFKITPPKSGFYPVKPSQTFKHHNTLFEFIEKCLNRNDIIYRDRLLEYLEGTTGISGATLGHVNPNRCKMDFPSAQAEADALEERQKVIKKIQDVLEKIENRGKPTKSTVRKLKNVNNYLVSDEYQDARDELSEIEDIPMEIRMELPDLFKPLIGEDDENQDGQKS